MKSLVWFELYKVLKQKSIYVLGVILLGYLTSIILLNAGPVDNETDDKPFEGPISAEFLSNLENTNTDHIKNDLNIPTEVYDRIIENLKLHQSIDNRKQAIDEKVSQLQEESYPYRKVTLERDLLMKISRPVFYEHDGLNEIIESSLLNTLLIGSLLTVGLASIFSSENTTGLNPILLSSKNGRRQIVTAKIVTAIIFTAFVCFSINISSLLVAKLAYGTLGWGSLLQYIYSFGESPYPLTMGQYYLTQLGLQFISAISFSLFILLVSACSKNSLISFFVSGFVFIQFLWIDLDGKSRVAETVINFSFYGLMKVNGLFRTFETINIGGYPLLYPLAALVFTIILSLITVKVLYICQKRREIG